MHLGSRQSRETATRTACESQSEAQLEPVFSDTIALQDCLSCWVQPAPMLNQKLCISSCFGHGKKNAEGQRHTHLVSSHGKLVSCSWFAKCNTARIHCNDNDKDHLAEETGGRAGETERPKTSRPPGALVSTRAPSQPRTSRVLSVTPPCPDRPAQASPRALQGYEAGLTEASLTQSSGTAAWAGCAEQRVLASKAF